ncbi:MAG: DNA polymerase III subunit gamma/tau [Xanthobacteraceae bacterium]
MNDADPSGHAVAEPSLLDAAEPDRSAATSPPEASGYRVLARKYRPATFTDLIGQEAMVRTITNAFATGRIPQAWILTGVRGVGKTTTARILARALNYELKDGPITAPTVDMPALGLHCAAIMESRHLDVIEMDAASHNSVDDVRQINDAIRYAPVSARYKVYILDEVHMLSTAAFNALLKTLEEPPPHAKFIFATTEIRKVPITILSRCQRFDLRRLDTERLMAHLEMIASREAVEAEPDALALIARAADGSVRDALSLFDQAIAHAAGTVRAEDVRGMLGLADRHRVIDLFEKLMQGDIANALGEMRDQYDSGADPLVVLNDLAEFTHFVTRMKAVPALAEDRSVAEAERVRGRAFAADLSMRTLSRTWQMLFKGLAEVSAAPKPIAAAEMVLVRIAYAADLPAPEDLIRALAGDGPSSPAGGLPPQQPSPQSGRGAAGPAARSARLESAPPERSPPPAAPPRAALATRAGPTAREAIAEKRADAAAPTPEIAPRAIASFADLIALAGERRDLPLKTVLERDVRLVHFEDGKLEVALEPSASRALIGDLARKLSELTGRRWMVVLSTDQGAPTVRSQLEAQQAEIRSGVQADPLVQRVLAQFPGAQIVNVRPRESTEAGLPPAVDAEGETEDVMVEPPAEDDASAFGAHSRTDDVDDDL